MQLTQQELSVILQIICKANILGEQVELIAMLKQKIQQMMKELNPVKEVKK